ncbi:toll-like receptor 4 [Mytilus californianus]|uniref:toll-like receptor 4 n=1 Tax=Mytilus californianus TaxID=6549 RepID=UPI00224844FE|nr:toll-like receptor 4 [Mytilus californianus]
MFRLLHSVHEKNLNKQRTMIITAMVNLLFVSTFLSVEMDADLKFSSMCFFNTQCRCFNETGTSKLHVDCANGILVEIPEFPQNVYILNLQHNRIKEIEDNVFQSLTNLSLLDLSHNKITLLKLHSFKGLGELKVLNLNDNPIAYTRFPNGTFIPLVSLSHLCIKSTTKAVGKRAKIFSDKTMSDLKTLEKLEIDIPTKSATPIIFGEGYKYLNHLISLNIGRCYYPVLVDENTFQFMSRLTIISFDIQCNMFIHPGGHRSLQSIRQLYVHRLVKDLVDNLLYFNNLTNELKLTPIETLSFQNTFPDSFDYYPWNPISKSLNNSSLKILIMTENRLGESFPPSKLYPPPLSLQELNLSSNKLEQFALDLGNIRNLSLRNNVLGGFLSTHSYSYKRSTISNSFLEFIDLSMNGIEKLTFLLFKGQPNLKYINLNHNKLQKITFDVSRLKNLRYLDLSSNNFTTLDEKAMAMFDGLSKNTFFTVNLQKNALLCTCNTLPFLKWISKTKVALLLNDKCNLEDGTVVSFNPINSIIKQVQKGCTTYTTLVIALSICLAVMLTVLILALVYKYRWKLRYMFYLAKSKHYSNKASNDHGEYTYDAFISYCDNDRAFVLKDCIGSLENEGNYKLCVHQRDFLPGQEITVNITNAIHDSRKTVCIITRKFLESYYCMFEFNMARMENIYSRDGRNIIFLVFLEQIQPKEMPLMMLELIEKQSYIEYPNDEEGNIVFWGKIKEAIHS